MVCAIEGEMPEMMVLQPVKLQIEPDILPSSLEIMAKEVQMTHDQREIHRKKRILE